MDAINAMDHMGMAADDGLASAFGRFYKVTDLAKHLKVSPGTLYAAVAAGDLEAISVGGNRGALRVEHGAFADYLRRCRTRALAPVA